MPIVAVQGYLCDRCRYVWVPKRKTANEPKICPKCKSPYWNKPRQLNLPPGQQAARQDANARKTT